MLESINIIGYIYDFIGVLILGIPTLRSPEMIEDEDVNTYWDGNPYRAKKSHYMALSTRIAFYFLVAGFASNLMSALGNSQIFNSCELLFGLMAILLSSVGILAIHLIYAKNSRSHLVAKSSFKKDFLLRWINNTEQEVCAKKNQSIDELKKLRLKNLKECRADESFKLFFNTIDTLISSINSAQTAEEFKSALEDGEKYI